MSERARQLLLVAGLGGAGTAYGLAGGLACRRAPAGPALLGGEAAMFLLTRGAAVTFLAELAAGAALPAVGAHPPRRRALGLAVITATVCLVGAAALRLFAHAHGWRGP